MLSRLQTLVQRIEQLRYTINNSKGSQKMGAEIALKNDIQKLNRFGSHYSIIKVIIKVYTGPNIQRMMEIYYTGITPQEAIEYTRLTLQGDYWESPEIEAFSIPVGRPIKL